MKLTLIITTGLALCLATGCSDESRPSPGEKVAGNASKPGTAAMKQQVSDTAGKIGDDAKAAVDGAVDTAQQIATEKADELKAAAQDVAEQKKAELQAQGEQVLQDAVAQAPDEVGNLLGGDQGDLSGLLDEESGGLEGLKGLLAGNEDVLGDQGDALVVDGVELLTQDQADILAAEAIDETNADDALEALLAEIEADAEEP